MPKRKGEGTFVRASAGMLLGYMIALCDVVSFSLIYLPYVGVHCILLLEVEKTTQGCDDA